MPRYKEKNVVKLTLSVDADVRVIAGQTAARMQQSISSLFEKLMIAQYTVVFGHAPEIAGPGEDSKQRPAYMSASAPSPFELSALRAGSKRKRKQKQEP
jgi:hypothetical protein